MTPTRELARQVTDVIEQLSDDLSVACIYGGAPAGPQGMSVAFIFFFVFFTVKYLLVFFLVKIYIITE